MNPITYSLITLISFFGTYIGLALSNIATEELTDTKKYLKFVKSIIFVLIIFFAIYKFNTFFGATIGILFGISIYFFSKENKILYISLGAATYLGYMFNQMFYVSALIVLYGIIVGTEESKIYINKTRKKRFRKKDNIKVCKIIFEKYYWYILISIIFYTIFQIIV